MDEKELKIISGAAHVFIKYGVKSVNMDDVARHLGVSKKTLYQFVTDKEDLVKKSVSVFCQQEDNDITAICQKGLNAIDENLEIMNYVSNMIQNIHPSVAYDIEKYHPAVFRQMRNHRQSAVYNCVHQNLIKGQKEGYYRKDFKADVIAKIYISRMESLFDPSLFPATEYKVTEVYAEVFRYHVLGIASAKGAEYLQSKTKTIKQ
ncbi:MAG: TetR/AcrR family transcriptional regulator [Flavobacteriales bacterium]